MQINIYGLALECQAASSDFETELVRPFFYFIEEDGHPIITVVVKEEEPPYQEFPKIPAIFSTPRNIVYKNRAMKIIDYFGKGIVVEESQKACFTLYSRDRNFLLEAFYLLVISLFGQHCDRSNMMRVHALALSYKDTAFLLPIPPGGGKSTMGIMMLEDPDIKLISDDEPIYDSSGQILPFSLRIGTLNQELLQTIPSEYFYSIDRMEFGQKYFIDCRYWDAQIEQRLLNKSVLFVSQRVLNGTPEIRPVAKRYVLKALIRDAVVGIGLYQGVEFLFSHSNWEVLPKFLLAFKRLRLALKLTRRSKTYQMILSNDIQENARIFQQFIKTFPTG
jgi:hypothetical protein